MHAKVIDPSNESSAQRELVRRAGILTPQEGVNLTPVPGVMVIRANSVTQPLPALYEPSLCFVLQGRKRAELDGEVYMYDALHYLVVSVTLPLCSQIIEADPQRPYLCLRIGIDVPVIADLLAQLPEVSAEGPEPDRGLYVARMSDEMFDAVVRLMKLLDSTQDAAVLAPSVLREIHYRALTGQLGQRLRQLCNTGANVQRIARAISLIRARFADPLRIEALAQAVHMSSSSLHHHFKSVTSMSPLQFQKHLRLHEARRLMLADGLDAASAAHRVGYESASQFNREYRRLFGAPPRREVGAVGRVAVAEASV